MGFLKDILGNKYGRLTVLSISKRVDRCYYYNCICDCGNSCVIRGASLRKINGTKSCGCIHKETTSKAKKIHGESGNKTAEYRAWKAMKKRCYNLKYEHYQDYGGRGITVCDRWLESYDNFLQDIGRRPSKKHSLDRYPDINGNYEPSNCRWATKGEQARGKRNNRWLEYNGERMVISDWAKKFNSWPSNLLVMLKKKTFEEVYKHYMK